MSGEGRGRVVDHEAPTEELSWSAWVGRYLGEERPKGAAISAETALPRKRIGSPGQSPKPPDDEQRSRPAPHGRFQLRGH